MISGSIVAIVTPMHEDGRLDFEALARLVDWHIKAGTSAIVGVGTTGESATLDHQEHCQLIRALVEFVAGRIPVIAGTGANSTSEALELTQCAKDDGADIALLVTPYYNKPTQNGLYQHFREIAEQVDIPQILYNVPGRTAIDMSVETVIRLAELPNIIGIKEAASDGPDRVANLRKGCGDDFALYSGNDDTACQFVLNGGKGVVSVTANLAPDLMAQLMAYALTNEEDQATELNARLSGLHRELFCQSSPIPVKWALVEMGKMNKGIRLPLTWLETPFEPQLKAAMQQAGII